MSLVDRIRKQAPQAERGILWQCRVASLASLGAALALPTVMGLRLAAGDEIHPLMVAVVLLGSAALAASCWLTLSVRRGIAGLVDAARTREAAAGSALEAKDADLQWFARAVSHELRGSVSVLRGLAELIKQAALAGKTDRAQQLHALADRTTVSMSHVLDGIVELASTSFEVEATDSELSDAAREAAELLASRISRAHARVEIPPQLPQVRADRGLLTMIFRNLIENAVKYGAGREAPRVRIDAHCDGEMVLCEVADAGVGIPDRYRDTVFELFHRIDRQGEGSGIGLASVRRAVEAHGGRIWVDSAGEGQGSTFYFTLPAGQQLPMVNQHAA